MARCQNKYTTLLDLARQAKIISGNTACFDGKIQAGIPFSGYPTGVDLSSVVQLGVVSQQDAVLSGNSATTIFDVANPLSPTYDPQFDPYSGDTWSNPLFSAHTVDLNLPITIFSADTQEVGPIWTLTQTGMTGDHIIGVAYTGYTIQYSFYNIVDVGLFAPLYSGFTTAQEITYSAGTLDYKGPLDYLRSREDATVDNRLTTKKLRVTGGASASTIGYVLTQVDEIGSAEWVFNSASASTNTFVASGLLSGSDELELTYNTGGSVPPIDLSSLRFSGNTSGDCINELWVDTISGCSDTITIGSNIQSVTSSAGNSNNFVFASNSTIQNGNDNAIILGGNTHRISILGPGNATNSAIIGGGNNLINVGGVNSAIIGGQDNVIESTVRRSVILGGDSLSASTDETVYVPKFNINEAPNDNTLTQVLVLDSNGDVKYRDASSISADTNSFVTGGTLNDDTLTLTRNDGVNIIITGFSSTFTGNTSGDCITDLYVSNIHSCSPLNINPLDEGDVYYGSTSGVTIDVINSRIGIGSTSPSFPLHIIESGQLEVKFESSGNNSFLTLSSSDGTNSYIDYEKSGGDRWIVGSHGGDNDKFKWASGTTFASDTIMTLTRDGDLGIGTASPTEKLHVEGGDLLINNSSGNFTTDIENASGPVAKISGGTTDVTRLEVNLQPIGDGSLSMGIRGSNEISFSTFGKPKDSFIRSSDDNNGLNFISAPGVGTDDYIRFYAGQTAVPANTPDMIIIGTGGTRGNIGINTSNPTEKLHVQDGNIVVLYDQDDTSSITVKNFNTGEDARASLHAVVRGEGGIDSSGLFIMFGTGYTGDLIGFSGEYLPNSLTIATAGGADANRAHVNIGSRRTDGQIRFFTGDENYDNNSLLGIWDPSGLTLSGSSHTFKLNTDTIQIRNGAVGGHVLTATDSDGNASWQPASGGGTFTGNTSGDCINELWVSNISGCTGDLHIGASSGDIIFDYTGDTSTPNLFIKGDGLIGIGTNDPFSGTWNGTPAGIEIQMPELNDNIALAFSETGSRRFYFVTDFDTAFEPVHIYGGPGPSTTPLLTFYTNDSGGVGGGRIGMGTVQPQGSFQISLRGDVANQTKYPDETNIVINNTSTGWTGATSETPNSSAFRFDHLSSEKPGGLITSVRQPEWESGIYSTNLELWNASGGTLEKRIEIESGWNTNIFGDVNINYGGRFYTDLNNDVGPNMRLTGGSDDLVVIYTTIPNGEGMSIGSRGETEPDFPGYGKNSDGFIYSSAQQNGLNIISSNGVDTEDYIRFYAGTNATVDTAMIILGTGATQGFIGMGTDSPTEKLHVEGSFRLVDGTEQNGYVLTSDANGVGSWQPASGSTSGSMSFTVEGDNGTPFTITSGDTLQFVGLDGINIGVSDPEVRVAVDYTGLDSVIMEATDGTGITVDGANDKLLIFDESAGASGIVKYINVDQLGPSLSGNCCTLQETFNEGTVLEPWMVGVFTPESVIANLSADTVFIGTGWSGATPAEYNNITLVGDETTTGFPGRQIQLSTKVDGLGDQDSGRIQLKSDHGGLLSEIRLKQGDIYLTGTNLGTPSNGDILRASSAGGTIEWADPSSLPSAPFTGNTSGDCISELWVTTISGCSPVTIGSRIQSLGSTASGIGSIAYGQENVASGEYSQAFGKTTTATGSTAHAQGEDTMAYGQDSHAEGKGTTASGDQSHAEGGLSVASGAQSHAEGAATVASGEQSHAEGEQSVASGTTSHAQGGFTIAGNLGSHAEGIESKSFGVASHAEGAATEALGDGSHSEGQDTTASGNNSHAEGFGTEAGGSASHAEGFSTEASGEYSHSEGFGTLASGSTSHAEGKFTIAGGEGSHAGGYGHTSGIEILSTGLASFAHFHLGETSVSSGVEGDYSAILGGRDHSIGVDNTDSIIIGGQWNGITGHSGTYNSIIGGIRNVIGDGSGIGVSPVNKSVIIGGQVNYIQCTGGDARDNAIISSFSSFMSLRNAQGHVILGGNDHEMTLSGKEGNAIIGGTRHSISGEYSAIIGGNTNDIGAAFSNTVILGGSGITAVADDTVYVPNLNIGSFPVAVPQTNLSIDSSGNVVQGFSWGDSTVTAGNSSGDCITELWVTDVESCSPLYINRNNQGDIYIGEESGAPLITMEITAPNEPAIYFGEESFIRYKENEKKLIIGEEEAAGKVVVEVEGDEILDVEKSRTRIVEGDLEAEDGNIIVKSGNSKTVIIEDIPDVSGANLGTNLDGEIIDIPSDSRVKEIVQELPLAVDPLEFISHVKAYQFKWLPKTRIGDPNKLHYGFKVDDFRDDLISSTGQKI